jgi:hypothetical protein
MAYNIIGLRTADDAEHGGALYPVLGDQGDPYLVEIEPADGTQIMRISASGLAVRERATPNAPVKAIGTFNDIDVDVYITAARIVLACEKYEKGGGWIGLSGGGLIVAGAANAISHARTARRRRGKLLVGHIRYPWLVSVGARTKEGFGTSNGLRIIAKEKTPAGTRTIMLDLTLDKRADSPALAQRIAQRCANFRLDHDITPDNEFHSGFEVLKTAPRRIPEPKTYAQHTMPMAWHVAANSAYPKPAVSSPPPTENQQSNESPAATETLHGAAEVDHAARVCVWRACSLKGSPTSLDHCPECGVPTEPATNANRRPLP